MALFVATEASFDAPCRGRSLEMIRVLPPPPPLESSEPPHAATAKAAAATTAIARTGFTMSYLFPAPRPDAPAPMGVETTIHTLPGNRHSSRGGSRLDNDFLRYRT